MKVETERFTQDLWNVPYVFNKIYKLIIFIVNLYIKKNSYRF